jgi:hypothetical protein
MALYNHAKYLAVDTGDLFDHLIEPGTPAPVSAIYRCEACGRECVAIHGQPLPGQNHHQHNPPANIQWRAIVASTHR